MSVDSLGVLEALRCFPERLAAAHDGVVAVHRRQHVVFVADVGMHEVEPSIVEHVTNARQIAGVGQPVVDGDVVIGVAEHVAR